MTKQEAEELAERIRAEVPMQIVVIRVEPLGGASHPSFASEFAVVCTCRITRLPFAVKSLEHWEMLKEHVIVRLCKGMVRLLKRGSVSSQSRWRTHR